MNGSGPVLRDIHLPPAAWWPLAPGWWIVAALVLLLIGCAAWLLWRHARRRTRRAALREVDALATAYARDGDDVRLADGASRLLRRVARVVDAGAASLAGDAWRGFVLQYARDPATREPLERLLEARFVASPSLEGPALLRALRAWCARALDGRRRRAERGADRRIVAAVPNQEAAS